MVLRKNFECERDRWIGLWKKDPTNDCISQKDMKHNAAVQTLSSQMMATYGVSLRLVSSQAIRPYMDLKDDTPAKLAFKQKVFEVIIDTIKKDTNPFTGEVWGDNVEYGLTRPLVLDIIRYAHTGIRPSKSPLPHTKTVKSSTIKIFSPHEKELIDSMVSCVLVRCKTVEAREEFAALHDKLITL